MKNWLKQWLVSALPRLRNLTRWLVWFGLVGFIFAWSANWRMVRMTATAVSEVATVPTSSVALVFGAGLNRDGTPSDALADRVQTALELYQAGKVQKILMSGDNGSTDYDEVSSMKRYAVAHGVPAQDVVLDYAGFRTYDSCYRAQAIFGVRNVIAVSQAFHLPRIIYTCQALGINTVGVSASKRPYRYEKAWDRREFVARAVAWLEVNVTKPKPKFLGKSELIFGE
jgi:vancomycin permeability regulator SanA